MTQNEQTTLHRQTTLRSLARRIRAGVINAKETRQARGILILYFFAIYVIWNFRRVLFYKSPENLLAPTLNHLTDREIIFFAVLGLIILLLLLGTPRGSRRARQGLLRAGLTNYAGEAPVLVAKRPDGNIKKLTIWEFDPCGVPLSQWEDRQGSIEVALDLTIAKMEYQQGRKRVRVYATPAENDFPSLLYWQDEFLSPESFVLALGESLTGPVTVNLAHIPHILLGGSTGSGKSVLLKLLLMQALRKGAVVYIADFKGGVDFPKVWRQTCQMCFDETILLEILDELLVELAYRKEVFQSNDCPNLDAFNQLPGANFPRHIFACDEVAELLDKTGLSKERKETVSLIESKLATIARQGRAFGIHLLLATQRPDANILSGQIKNNIDFRACGRADKVLSQIILDNTDAAEFIPKDASGRFLLSDGTLFQVYWFEE